MVEIHPQYINDSKGEKSLVVISVQEFDSIIEELEELEDIRLYDEAKKEDSGKRILLSDYLSVRKTKDV